MDFGDTVDGARPLHAEIWRRVTGGSGTEGADGAGDKQAQAMLCCNVQDVVKAWEHDGEPKLAPTCKETRNAAGQQAVEISPLTGDVDGARQGHVSLPNSTEKGAVVNQPSDTVVHHDFTEVLVV